MKQKQKNKNRSCKEFKRNMNLLKLRCKEATPRSWKSNKIFIRKMNKYRNWMLNWRCWTQGTMSLELYQTIMRQKLKIILNNWRQSSNHLKNKQKQNEKKLYATNQISQLNWLNCRKSMLSSCKAIRGLWMTSSNSLMLHKTYSPCPKAKSSNLKNVPSFLSLLENKWNWKIKKLPNWGRKWMINR